MSEAVFDSRLGEFRQWQASPWGRLRYTIAAANLLTRLGPAPLEILDVGGGNGLDAVELAAAGHRVTIADISESALAEARDLAAHRGLSDRIGTRVVGVEALSEEFGTGGFDVALCHNVIQHVQDSMAVIEGVAGQLNAAGSMSVIAPNAAADPLLAAVRSMDLEQALELLDAPTRFTATYGTHVRACYADAVTADLGAAGMDVVAHFGIRCVCDLLVDDEQKSDPIFFAQLERLELALAQRPAYAQTARFFHLIAVHGGEQA